MRIARTGAMLGVGLAAVIGCAKPGEESQAKRSPAPPPAPDVSIPDALSIPVQVHGAAAAPVVATTLRGLTPDFADVDHRAWRLTSLLGEAVRGADAVIEAVGADGVAISLDVPAAPQGPQPVLLLTRRGDVAAAMIDPDEPFPAYHGQGGRLRRRGDPLPRISPVTMLRVSARRAGGANRHLGQDLDPAVLARLAFSRDGAPAALPSPERLAEIPTVPVDADGENRPAWTVRGVAASFGAGTRVSAVIGRDGTRVPIPIEAWTDGSRTPVLRANRRGTQLKFSWVRDGAVARDSELHDVAGLELTGG